MSVSIFDPDFSDLPRGGSGPPRRCMGFDGGCAVVYWEVPI